MRTRIAQCVRDQLVKKPMFTPVGNISVNRLLLWKFESVAKSQRKQSQFTVNETLRPHKTDRFWQLLISCALGNAFVWHCFEPTFEIIQPKRHLQWIDLVQHFILSSLEMTSWYLDFHICFTFFPFAACTFFAASRAWGCHVSYHKVRTFQQILKILGANERSNLPLED